MNLFDIIGPIMVGPSSSHTAGAVRIGLIARKLMGEPIQSVTIVSAWFFSCDRKGTWHRPCSGRRTARNGTG